MSYELHSLPNPPLFVTAYADDGRRYEGLLEPDRPAPDWFIGRLAVHVAAPSGVIADIDLKHSAVASGYANCLRELGADRAWSPAVDAVLDIVPDLEIWAPEDTDVEIHDDGPILAIEADPPKALERTLFYAVLRNAGGQAVHVANEGRIYLETDESADDGALVPRALLDTGLAGAFWGFNDHGNAAASLLVAKRLLGSMFGGQSPSVARNEVSVTAAAHAVLIHSVLLPEYGPHVMEALAFTDAENADAALLRAMLGLARLSIGQGDDSAVVGDVQAAIQVAASRRPAFGGTLRILNAHFGVLADVARSTAQEPVIDAQIAAVGAMLRTCYVGGQSATYLGDPAVTSDARWHVVPTKKKTLQP